MPLAYLPYVDGMDYGCGVNTLTGDPAPAVLLNVIPKSGSLGPGQLPQLKNIENSDSYVSFLNVAANAEGSGWGDWGEATVKTSASFLRSQQINQHSVAFMCNSVVQTAIEALPGSAYSAITLMDGMAELIVQNPAKFLDQYGTHFIGAFTYGGSFTGSIKVQAISSRDFQDIQAKLNGSVVTVDGAGSFSSTFQSTLQGFNGNHDVEAFALVNGDVRPFTVDNAAQMQQQMEDLGQNLPNGTGGRVTAICYPWESVEAITSLPNFVRGSLTPTVDTDAISELQDEHNRIAYALATAQTMLDNSDYAGPSAQQQVNQIQATLQAAKGAIVEMNVETLSTISSLDPPPPGMTQVSNYLVAESLLQDLSNIAGRKSTINYYYFLDDAFKSNTGGVSDSVVIFPTTEPQQLQSVVTASHGDGNAVAGFYFWLDGNNQLNLQAYFQGPKSGSNLGQVITPSETGSSSTASWSDTYPYDQITVSFG